MIMICLKQRKINFKPRIKLNHNTYKDPSWLRGKPISTQDLLQLIDANSPQVKNVRT